MKTDADIARELFAAPEKNVMGRDIFTITETRYLTPARAGDVPIVEFYKKYDAKVF